MPKCPYCGEWFRTKRGLLQHIYKSHPFAIETISKDVRKFFGIRTTSRRKRKSKSSSRKSSKSRRRRSRK